ncbi:hypothetical protein [Streptomyces mirabilis]|uniref:hypothetical protein n=1 Tax=Streptomyces mirabilis TaxID=68239 RepID=UPI0036E60294
MAGPTGRGNSLGAALGDLLRAQVTPRHRLSTYSAKHWHAQLSQLTGTRRGYEALESAGLDVKPDTLIKWLSDPECNVRRSYRDLIHTAYENVAIVPADPIPDHVKNGQFEISGIVKTGADERERGNRRAAPLRIDGSRGDWSDIETLWLAGDLRDDDFEDRFIDDVIVADIGEGTDGWEFNGSSYSVELDITDRRSSNTGSELRRFMNYMSVTGSWGRCCSSSGWSREAARPPGRWAGREVVSGTGPRCGFRVDLGFPGCRGEGHVRVAVARHLAGDRLEER